MISPPEPPFRPVIFFILFCGKGDRYEPVLRVLAVSMAKARGKVCRAQAIRKSWWLARFFASLLLYTRRTHIYTQTYYIYIYIYNIHIYKLEMRTSLQLTWTDSCTAKLYTYEREKKRIPRVP